MMRFTYQMLMTEMGLSLLSHNKQLEIEIRRKKKKSSTYCRLTLILQDTILFSWSIVWFLLLNMSMAFIKY